MHAVGRPIDVGTQAPNRPCCGIEGLRLHHPDAIEFASAPQHLGKAGELVGILSSLDIAKAAGDHRFATRTYVFNHDQEFGDRAR